MTLGPQRVTLCQAETPIEKAMTEERDEVTLYAPRGKWEFTDAQRIIIAILLWLNIIILTLAVLAVLGMLNG